MELYVYYVLLWIIRISWSLLNFRNHMETLKHALNSKIVFLRVKSKEIIIFKYREEEVMITLLFTIISFLFLKWMWKDFFNEHI